MVEVNHKKFGKIKVFEHTKVMLEKNNLLVKEQKRTRKTKELKQTKETK